MKAEIINFPEFDHVITIVEFKKRIYYVLSFYNKHYREMLEVVKVVK